MAPGILRRVCSEEGISAGGAEGGGSGKWFSAISSISIGG